jgi:hypothetical protein
MRTDTHRPSAINPEEYTYVAMTCIKIESFGDCQVALMHRETIKAHMVHTGGNYSTHEHGGNCAICGSVNAIYTALFYHQLTNTYIHVGTDCAQKLDMGNAREMNLFRKAIGDAREAQAGKRKAQAILADNGLTAAWDVYTTSGFAPEHFTDPLHDCHDFGCKRPGYEETTITDIVGKLVKYGSISENQMSFVGKLLAKIPQREQIAAERAAEREAAAPCPTGRVTVSGIVLSIKEHEGNYGFTTKMTVKANEGFIVWVTMPSGADVERGSAITFTATLTPSKDDPKFGFGKRPVMGVSKARKAPVQPEQPVQQEQPIAADSSLLNGKPTAQYMSAVAAHIIAADKAEGGDLSGAALDAVIVIANVMTSVK